MNWKKTLLICIVILASAGALLVLIFSTEPTAAREGATKETAMLVDVISAEKGTYQPTIVATGSVVPEQDIILSPRVNGEIISLSRHFTPGGRLQKGQVLLQIDPADYKNAVEMRKAELLQVQADLDIELGRQEVARRDFQLFNDTLSNENEALVLRKPQLNAARSRVESAKVAIEQAKLDLQRTTLSAPFDAHVLNRNANVGTQVAPGDNLGRLVGLDQYWVTATIPLAKVRWIRFGNGNRSKGSRVKITNETAWGQGMYREGFVSELVGSLEEETRMARVLVTVPDPLAITRANNAKPPLMIGEFVTVEIEGEEISDVVRLRRDYLRNGDIVWVMQDGKLSIRKVDILFQDAEYAYLSGGIEDGEQVVTTNLSTVVEGARLRIESSANDIPTEPSSGDTLKSDRE